MASSSTSAASEQSGSKRKRTEQQGAWRSQPPSKWRTRREHETYSTKLLDALRVVRARGGAGGGGSPTAPREVRDAADRALAVAARGRSRWSRAILASRARRRSLLRARLPASRAPSAVRQCTDSTSNSSSSAARKAKELGRMVPGCRKLAFPALLAEVSDYIAALEMQVRAMSAVAQALSSVSAPSGSSPPTAP